MTEKKKNGRPTPSPKATGAARESVAGAGAGEGDVVEAGSVTLNGTAYSARWSRIRPAPEPDEIAAIEADIGAKRRIDEPILVSKAGNILDGFVRAWAAVKLGLPEVPIRVYEHDLSEDAERELVLDRALLRRNLSLAAKRELARRYFDRSPPMGVRALALKLAVSRNTIKGWRAAGGQIDHRRAARRTPPVTSDDAPPGLGAAVDACEASTRTFVSRLLAPGSEPRPDPALARQMADRLRRCASSLTDAVEAVAERGGATD